jgi:hypothetical protein
MEKRSQGGEHGNGGQSVGAIAIYEHVSVSGEIERHLRPTNRMPHGAQV